MQILHWLFLLFCCPVVFGIGWMALRALRLRSAVKKLQGIVPQSTGVETNKDAPPLTLVAFPSFKFPLFVAVNANTAGVAQEILQSKRDTLIRYIPFVPKDSMFTAEGDEYKRHAKVVHNAIGKDFNQLLEKTIVQCSRELVSSLKTANGSGISRTSEGSATLTDTYSTLYARVQDMILLLTFGPDADKSIFDAAKTVSRSLLSFVAQKIPFNNKLPYLKKTALMWEQSRAATMAIVQDVDKHGEASKYHDTLLGLLTASRKKMGSDLTDKEVIGNGYSFGVGGNDSTAAGLTSTLYCLAKYPDMQDKLRQDLKAVSYSIDSSTIGKRVPSVAAFIKEALRLYPPFRSTIMRYGEAETVAGVKIPGDVAIMADFTKINTRLDVWGEDAKEFNYERHLRADADGPSSSQQQGFLSFGFGMRSCIGRKLAETILYRFVCDLISSNEISLGRDTPNPIKFAKYDAVQKPEPALTLIFKPLH